MRVSRVGVGAVLVVLGSLGMFGSRVTASTAGAQQSTASSYAGTASAEGLRMTYSVEDFVLTDRFVDSGAPVAQASASTVESVGFASAPYPGDLVLTAPPLLSSAVGAPVPGYPLVARSQYPTPAEQTVDQGVVHLTASSTASSSSASGAAGGPSDESASVGATRASAEVVHDEANGTVTSTATSNAESFSSAGVFRIGRVASSAKVVDTPAGDPQREVTLEVGEVTIVGQTVALTPDGLALPGTSTPLPDGSPLLSALVDHGIEVRYVAAEETPDGVVAPGVEVRVTHPLPGAPSPGVLVYRLGQASASARGGTGSLRAGVGEDVAADVSIGGTATPAGGVASGNAGTSTAAPAGPAPATGPTAAPAASAPSGAAAAAQIVAMPQWSRSWTMAFYLVIVLSGLVTVGGSQLIRLFGVRMPWTS